MRKHGETCRGALQVSIGEKARQNVTTTKADVGGEGRGDNQRIGVVGHGNGEEEWSGRTGQSIV